MSIVHFTGATEPSSLAQTDGASSVGNVELAVAAVAVSESSTWQFVSVLFNSALPTSLLSDAVWNSNSWSSFTVTVSFFSLQLHFQIMLLVSTVALHFFDSSDEGSMW